MSGFPVEDSIYRIAVLEAYPQLLHGISTRFAPDGNDWNLSGKRGSPQHPPDWNVALANRQKLAARLGISLGTIVGCQQVHGSEVALVTAEDAGRGMYPDKPSMMGADAMVTNMGGITLLVLSADCPPVFFYDTARSAIGLAHSGWKGTMAKIAANVVVEMQRDFGSRPEDIVAVIGPGIGPCCYAVGANVIEAAETAFSGSWEGSTPLLETRDSLTYFNLWEGIRRTLLHAGVLPENVTVEAVCTAHNIDNFYSHRAEAGQCGLFGAALGLREGH